ncbi:hypothetical protein BLL42_17280 [Pseudomonas frederiksbergensis]|uniref:Uncharacterized protein n=1 Tax=Pseudomonas frederiksbergensis TaxID=104087 RepID=A0A1J0ENM0_9PSED|nr:hypothetical protein BLL42_17280 [Pseudomonas frederiksbergensis]
MGMHKHWWFLADHQNVGLRQVATVKAHDKVAEGSANLDHGDDPSEKGPITTGRLRIFSNQSKG